MIKRNIQIVAKSSSTLSRAFSTKLPEEIRALQEWCKKFSNEELKPVADQLDRDCKYPVKHIKKLGELGLMGIGVASDIGGSNLSTLALSIVVEELSRGCGSTGAIVSIHNCLYASLLNRLGTDEQKTKYLKPYIDGSRIGAFALSESGLSTINFLRISLRLYNSQTLEVMLQRFQQLQRGMETLTFSMAQKLG